MPHVMKVGRRTYINGVKKTEKYSFLIRIFLVVAFNRIPIFSKDLTTFTISFALSFVSVIAELLLILSKFLYLLTYKILCLSLAYIGMFSLLHFLRP